MPPPLCLGLSLSVFVSSLLSVSLDGFSLASSVFVCSPFEVSMLARRLCSSGAVLICLATPEVTQHPPGSLFFIQILLSIPSSVILIADAVILLYWLFYLLLFITFFSLFEGLYGEFFLLSLHCLMYMVLHTMQIIKLL